MTLYVSFHGAMPKGIIAKKYPHEPEEIGTLNDYLKAGGIKNLCFEDGYIYWNRKTVSRDSEIGKTLYPILVEIRKTREVPKALAPDILEKLDTPTMTDFEEALFKLAEQSYQWWQAEQI